MLHNGVNEGFTGGGDLTIRSTDGVDFSVHSLFLSEASPVFSELLRDENRTKLIQFSDKVDVLALTLKFIYPKPTPIITSTNLLSDAVRVANTYQLENMKSRLREQLLLVDSPVSIHVNPFGALCVASTHGFVPEAELAAKVASERCTLEKEEDLKGLVYATRGRATAALVKLTGIPLVKTRILVDVLFHFERSPMKPDTKASQQSFGKSIIDTRPATEDVRIRGRPNSHVVQQTPFRPFATPVPTTPVANANGSERQLVEPYIPAPQYNSQVSMNRVYMSEVETPIRGSSFQENRDHFIRRFDEKWWNYPDEELQSLEPQLRERRALVIAIHYGGSDPLPATYVDALNITHALTKFGYHPKCIRVLADQVDVDDCKDKRWPNKENIVSGLKWLVEGTASGCKRFLFFAGHGHRLMTSKGDTYFTREGMLPKDFLTYTARNGKEVPDPKTVLFDDELNRLLVKVEDGTTLTVVFDCCHSGGLTVLVPETADLSSIRKRCLFTMSRRPNDPDEINDICFRALANQSGNFLGLPSRVDFGHNSDRGLIVRSELTNELVDQEAEDANALSFTAFPQGCEIISWAACDGSQLAREDANIGGRFTSAFTNGIFKEEEGVTEVTYRILNRRIQTEFDNHNEQVKSLGDPAASASAQDAVTGIRASKTQSAVQKDEAFQYPKLYVSNNIASIIADRGVVL
ncbi:unnamed protein product [Rhizoctonia solani]|uniref:BTB domain-containing protein n=1 Tax=Rhizoctonia solani TaxID=456999 RepID=A0A8H3GPT4_9AGAM|nr:unnamed protein product [Rhizoctonia solani]